MGFLRNLFGKKKLPSESAQRESTQREPAHGDGFQVVTSLDTFPVQGVSSHGERFQVVIGLDALFAAVDQYGRGALLFRTVKYSDVTQELITAMEQHYGERPGGYAYTVASYPFSCAHCLQEFPGSYKLSLMTAGAMGGGMVVGATPGFGKFGRSGKCPNCGNKEALLFCTRT
ncbi:MAG TPA: hypothetical protein VMV29_04765 [Ktedonobacterales bacterium]|nr:hypothetical protein [Ktedonobacterales bacterium]